MNRWFRDLGFGLRLAVGGSRGSSTGWVRLGLGAFGIAIAVAVLLGAASAGSVLSERDARQNAQTPVSEPIEGVAPTQLAMAYTDYRGQSISGTLVRHEDATSPVPPGAQRQVSDGEMVVSPALADLLDSPEGELLRPRFADYRVVGTIGKAGLVEPDDLRFVAGSRDLGTAGKIVDGEVLEDPGSRAYAFGGRVEQRPLPVELVMVVALATVVLLVPLLIFVVSSARIAGAERDRRLAALRLVGGDAGQVRRIAAGEALLPAAIGLVAGGALFVAFRPLADYVPLFGVGLFAEDILPAWWLVVLIVLGVPVLSVGAALIAMRRTVIEPLGVVRQGKPVRRRLWWRLVTLASGIAVLWYSVAALTTDESRSVGVMVGAGLLVIGIAMLLPWAVEEVIRRTHGGTPALQLAARRLQLDSGTSARVVSGVVVVLMGAVSLLLVINSTQNEFDGLAAHDDGGPLRKPPPSVLVIGGTADAVAVHARTVEAMTEVTDAHLALNYELRTAGEASTSAYVGDCYALTRIAAVGSCADGDVFFSVLDERYVGPYDQPFRPSSGDKMWLRAGSGAETEFVLPDHAREASSFSHYPVEGLLLTPGALDAIPKSADGYATLYLETTGVNVREGSDLLERVRNVIGIGSQTHVGFSVFEFVSGDERAFASIKATVYAGSTIVLFLAALSVLVLGVEQVRERRRALAAVSASGVGFSTLARSLLWQNAIPLGVGAVFALAGGIVLARFVMWIPGLPLVVDWVAIGGVVGMAAVLVLFVTVLSLPMLRAAVSVKNLRTE